MHTITISNALWGYISSMTDFSGGRIADAGGTPDGQHVIREDFDRGLIPGYPDGKYMRHGGYGHVRPEDEEGPDAELWAQWGECRMPRLDYYVGLQHGNPDPDSTGLLYPERLFANGEDDDGGDLPRSTLLTHLAAVGLQGHAEFWHPVQIYTGINRGCPVFRTGLKADTDIGPTWYSAKQKLDGKLPAGYEWSHHPKAKYGELYYGD
jgi:hypothetical protein